MSDNPASDANSKPTPQGGEAGQRGSVNIRTGEGGQIQAGGDIVGGDKIENYLQLDVEKLVRVLREAMPNDPAPEHLQEALNDFQLFHVRLFEWKEVHNYLNDVIYTLDQFSREVERLDASGATPEVRRMRRMWRPVAQKVELLLEGAATLKHIGPAFVRLESGGMQGPRWAVELEAARARLDELLAMEALNAAALYDSTYDFSDIASRHMYLADKQLRDTASELFNLSRIVLGSVSGE